MHKLKLPKYLEYLKDETDKNDAHKVQLFQQNKICDLPLITQNNYDEGGSNQD